MERRIRGIRDIPNTTKRIKTALRMRNHYDEYDIYNELAGLGRERQRLNKEKNNWEKRIDRISKRLEEIDEEENELMERLGVREKINKQNQNAKDNESEKKAEVILKY
ncbi:hypothetical protein GF312_08915 [Candidatus Poribacteria bacterium]|nr:hypothetical protein [Candidatus Poribacteria bacterium]